MKLAIIDYGSGNLRSAAKAFERAVRECGLEMTVCVTADATEVVEADRIVLPGVGAFADCRAGLLSLPGMRDALEHAVIHDSRPFLGICVGMQLLATLGREHGEHPGFGWIDGEVAAIPAEGVALKIPHMGWNDLRIEHPDHPILAGIEPGSHAYFVHSFAFVPADPTQILASVDYGTRLTAVIGRDNLVGTQFHPEKSQATELRLITNFLSWQP
ncbi:MAG: imidazole glycerol phosphate synthase subunit HisH [Rhodospirillales bacterium]|nr:imidazole glycerol phosphate synthase subunit HisH [Rhodospirillales bacterium]